MAEYETWSQPIFPQGESFIYYAPSTPAILPHQINAGPKPAPHQHKKHGKTHKRVTIDSVDIPVKATWPTGGALCLSAISALAFTCALIFHGIMFYYALETPMWVVMCWPFLLIPPIICNSIYLAFMAKKVSVTPNTKIVYLYVLFAIGYMAWATYIIATTFKEGKCNEASYYSLVVSILALATVACALEWWLAVSKILKHTATELNVTVAVYQKSPTKRKLVVTLKNNGKVVKEATFKLEKFVQEYYIDHSRSQTGSTVWLVKKSACYGNERYGHCPMKYNGQCSAKGSQFNTTASHYENEKLKQDWPEKDAERCLEDGAPLKNVADQYENKKLQDQFTEECETDDSSVNNNNNKTQNNIIV